MTDAIRSTARAAGLDVAADARLKKAEDAKKAEDLARAPAAASAEPATDEIQLSGVTEKVMAAPEVNSEKVEAIKQAIREGNYPLNPRGIAASFYSLEKLIAGDA